MKVAVGTVLLTLTLVWVVFVLLLVGAITHLLGWIF